MSEALVPTLTAGDQLMALIREVAVADQEIDDIKKISAPEDFLQDYIEENGFDRPDILTLSQEELAAIGKSALLHYFDHDESRASQSDARMYKYQLLDTLNTFFHERHGKRIRVDSLDKNHGIYELTGGTELNPHGRFVMSAEGKIKKDIFNGTSISRLVITKGFLKEYLVYPLGGQDFVPQVRFTIEN